MVGGRFLRVLELNTRILMFGKSSLLGECSATETEERRFLAVVPDMTILHRGNETRKVESSMIAGWRFIRMEKMR